MSFQGRCSFAIATVMAFAASGCELSPLHVASDSNAPRLCPGGSIQIVSDARHYAGCTEIAGDLRIEDATVSDLLPLADLRAVHGALVVSHDAELTDLSGLEQLTSVERLELADDPMLASVSALGRLSHAPVVRILDDSGLESLHGLEALTRVESLELSNDGVIETSGLAGLREVGALSLIGNSKLISLKGLNGVTRARSVHIEKNRLLCAELGLLPALSEVGDALVLSRNPSVSRRELDQLFRHVKPSVLDSNLLSRGLALH